MHESPRLPKPNRREMALWSIAILERVVQAAQKQPVDLTEEAKLAIGWLMHDGIAADFQAGTFAAAVTTHVDAKGTDWAYMRHTHMYQMLEAWRREIRARDYGELGDGEEIGGG